MKRECTRPPLVVVSLREDPDDHPRPALQTQGEQAGFFGNPRGPFAKPLPRQSQGIQPLRATARRPRQYRVPSTPEGKAAVNRLLVTNGPAHPYPSELGKSSSGFHLALSGNFVGTADHYRLLGAIWYKFGIMKKLKIINQKYYWLLGAIWYKLSKPRAESSVGLDAPGSATVSIT